MAELQQPLEGGLGGTLGLSGVCAALRKETQGIHTFGGSADPCSPGRAASPSARPAAHPEQH